MKVKWSWLGLTPYDQAFELMSGLKADVVGGRESEYLLFLEHPNVITQGKNEPDGSGLISAADHIERAGFQLVKADRGGKTTLHNPGQLVGYLVFDLRRNKYRLKPFVELVAKTIVEVLGTYDLAAHYSHDEPGIYVNNSKIGFIGLNAQDNVTTHGFALNVRNDLKPFAHIVPCGNVNQPITSLHDLLDGHTSVYDVYWRFVTVFEHFAQCEMEEVETDDLLPA